MESKTGRFAREREMKLYKTLFSLLLCCSLALILLLSGCVSEQQAPDISAEQMEELLQPETDATTSDAESPVPETPGRASEQPEPASGNTVVDKTGSEEEITEMKMTVQIGESTFTATLEDNAAADALVGMMENDGPVTIQMSDYSGFEKVGILGTSLPTSNSQTTTQAGDIVLYQGNQIVLFYGSNSWSYTRLGKIDDLTGWAEALGQRGCVGHILLGRLNHADPCAEWQSPALTATPPPWWGRFERAQRRMATLSQ